MIVVELIKMICRPRTWLILAMLVALPTLVAVLLAVTDLGPRPGTGPPFLSAVLNDGTLFPLAALGVVLPLLLPIAVAVLGGEAIAGESQTGTLRYLLVRPVGRTHLLLAKLATVVAFVLLAVFVVAAVSYAEGRLLLGKAPATGTVSLSGSTLTQQELGWRTALALGYVIISMLGVAAIALFFSTLTTSAIGAALGTIGVLGRLNRVARAGRGRRVASLSADPLLAGLRRSVPRPDSVARRGAWAGGSAGIPDCFHAGCLGKLRHERHR
jgi:ABC-2 type transport system permease protein